MFCNFILRIDPSSHMFDARKKLISTLSIDSLPGNSCGQACTCSQSWDHLIQPAIVCFTMWHSIVL